jgi:hypothetical protein
VSSPVRPLGAPYCPEPRLEEPSLAEPCLAGFRAVGGAAAGARRRKSLQQFGWVTGARLVASVWLSFGCGNAAPPDRAEYPALVFPARLPEPTGAGGAAGKTEAPPQATGKTEAPPQAAGTAAVPAEATAQPNAPEPEPAVTPLLTRTPASPLQQRDLPDPEPLVQRGQWRYTLVYDKGAIRVSEPDPLCLERAQATARKIGRYAFELWLGRDLVERVRFDFPLLAAEELPTGPRRPTRETPRFAPGAVVSITLRIPASERATSARILDRATGQSTLVPWPPTGTETKVLRDCPRPPPPAPARGAAGSEPKPTTVGR